MYVVGTAGHVDHGKSALVEALTGIDPDRLGEEKARGLTIDLGFAWLTLPSGRSISIVDVPGHERFIKNMLAGAGGLDLAMLVVAADEGPMPQTREHLAILELLDVQHGIVVLTKCDTVDGEYLDLVEAELDDTLGGTRLATAPRIRTSALRREGLDDLLTAIDEMLDAAVPRRDLGRPRLPIDRVFTVQGFGTVVTGTLVDGALAVGQEVELQPGGADARIRGLQRHGDHVDRLEPGTRAAVNLAGLRPGEVERGMTLAAPGSASVARAADVHLEVPATLGAALSHNMGVTFLSGTAESEARLRLLDAETVEPGGSAWGQVVLERPLPLVPGDRYVLRTPNSTVAGGRVVALDPRRHRRNDATVLARLERALAGSPAERLADAVAASPASPDRLCAILSLEPDAFVAALDEAVAQGLVRIRGDRVIGENWLAVRIDRLVEATRDYLDRWPLRAATPREHARSAAALGLADFELVVEAAIANASLELVEPGGLSVPGRVPEPSADQRAAASAYLGELRAGRFAPDPATSLDPELLGWLGAAGEIVDLGGGIVFDRGAYDEAVALIVGEMELSGQITLAEVRDLLGTSRKYVQPLLEHLDQQKITRRAGDVRHLGRAGAAR